MKNKLEEKKNRFGKFSLNFLFNLFASVLARFLHYPTKTLPFSAVSSLFKH